MNNLEAGHSSGGRGPSSSKDLPDLNIGFEDMDVDVDLSDIKVNPMFEQMQHQNGHGAFGGSHSGGGGGGGEAMNNGASSSDSYEDFSSGLDEEILISGDPAMCHKSKSATTSTPGASNNPKGSASSGPSGRSHPRRKGPFIKNPPPPTATAHGPNLPPTRPLNHPTVNSKLKTPSVLKQQQQQQAQGKKKPDYIDLTRDNDDDEDVVEIEDSEGSMANEDEFVQRMGVNPNLQKKAPIIETNPFDAAQVAENCKKLGNEMFKKGEYHKALDMYTRAISAAKNEPSYYTNRSACYMMIKKFKEAINDAKTAIQLDPTFDKGYLRLIRSLLALGDVKGTEQSFESLDSQKITCDVRVEKMKLSQLKQFLVDIEASRGKSDHRKVLFLTERALEIASGDVQLRMLKADALFKLGRFSETGEICSDTLQADSMCVEAIYLRCLCLYQSDNLDKAVQFIKQALQFSPDSKNFLHAYRNIKQLKDQRELGASCFTSGKYAEAKGHYIQCLQVLKNFDHPNATIESKLEFNLALISQKLGALDESLEHSNKAIGLNESYIKAILHRAGIHTRKEMYDEAVRDYETVNRIDPKTKDIRRLLQDSKLQAKRAKRKDYYKILGIGKDASNDEIKKAYKKRALIHHPDRHASASEAEKKDQERKFKDLGEAYEVLSDSKKRSRYDAGVDLNDSPDYGPGAYDPSEIFSMFFAHQPGGGMGGGHQYRGGGGGGPHGFHQFRSGSGGFGGYHH